MQLSLMLDSTRHNSFITQGPIDMKEQRTTSFYRAYLPVVEIYGRRADKHQFEKFRFMSSFSSSEFTACHILADRRSKTKLVLGKLDPIEHGIENQSEQSNIEKKTLDIETIKWKKQKWRS
jgi:hypothetical protein